MSKLINCPKCGTLFLSKKWEICDDCYKKHKDLIKQILFFISNPAKNQVHINEIIEEFKITVNELEALLARGKFIDYAKKLVFNCTTCKKLSTSEACYSFVCRQCSQKIKDTVGPPKKYKKNVPANEV